MLDLKPQATPMVALLKLIENKICLVKSFLL